MTPNRHSRYSGKPRAVKFRLHMLPRLRARSGACNIQVPALRENEVINLAFLEQLEAYAEADGLTNPLADHGFHQEFLDMSALEMTALTRQLVEAFAECFTEPIDLGEPNPYYTLCATFDTLLYLIARGNILLGEEGGVEFCKPEGGSPTPTLQRKILARLRADRPLHFLALEIETEIDVADPDRGAGHPVKSPTSRTGPRTIHYPKEGFAFDIEPDHLCIRATEYHTDSLLLSWEELFDIAKGLGIDTPRVGSPQ